jgi:hypothetical protein
VQLYLKTKKQSFFIYYLFVPLTLYINEKT